MSFFHFPHFPLKLLFALDKLHHPFSLFCLFPDQLFIMLNVPFHSVLVNLPDFLDLFGLFLSNPPNQLIVLFSFFSHRLQHAFVTPLLKLNLDFKVLQVIRLLDTLKFQLLQLFHLSEIFLLLYLKSTCELLAWGITVLLLLFVLIAIRSKFVITVQMSLDSA
jgi:hypothetical protein